MRRPHKKIDRLTEDLKYNSKKVSKFINYVMLDGKKSVATKIVYNALAEVEKSGEGKAMEIFETALSNVAPEMEVKSRRVGGANYQVPIPVKAERQLALSIRWIIDSARKKKGKEMHKRLAEVFLDSFKKEGEAYKKKEDTHKMAEANKAFAHFAW